MVGPSKYKKINNCEITPIKLQNTGKDFRGNELFETEFPNIFLLAKKNSGKTVTIFNIIKKMIDKHTMVIIFCSTIHKDPSWEYIINWLKKKNVPYVSYTSINEDGLNQIEQFYTGLQKAKEESDDEEGEEPRPNCIQCNEIEHEEEEEEKAPIIDKYIMICDDISDELKDKKLAYFVKRNRHFRTKVILSSQYYNDLAKDARTQMDYILVWPRLPEEKLEEMKKLANVSCHFPQLLQMYKDATAPNKPGEKSHNFIYIDVGRDKYRRNFNEQFNCDE